MQALRDLVHPRIDQSGVCAGMFPRISGTRIGVGARGIDHGHGHELVENMIRTVDVGTCKRRMIGYSIDDCC